MTSFVLTWTWIWTSTIALLVLPLSSFSNAQKAEPGLFLTQAEKTNFIETGRMEEVDAWAAALKKRFPSLFRTLELGTSPEGRPLKAYALGTEGKGGKLPVVLLIAGIHAGEIDGKDAGMIFLRDLLSSGKSSLLNKLTILFVPVFNIDGFARFGKYNRPNQVGPAETGWRVTSQNLNLNRDFLKAQAPEMRALLKLVQDWDPLITADLHVTNGADFQYDVGIAVQPKQEASMLSSAGKILSDGIVKNLNENGFLGLPFYPSFTGETPESGIEDDWAPPRYSQGYFSARNRIGILVETHSWKPFGRRVKTTIQILSGLIDLVGIHGTQWRKLADTEDKRSWNDEPLPLTYEVTEEKTDFDFAGYEFRRVISPISGKNEIEYNPSVPQIWKVPLQLAIKPKLVLAKPMGGYLVSAGSAGPVEEALKAHGLKYKKLGRTHGQRDAEVFRVGEFQVSPKSIEGRQTVTISGQWGPEKVDLPAGSLWVPSAQPKLKLVMNLLEPLAPDSLAHWGFFNSFLERREYMESYVAHSEGLRMLESDPQVKAEFQSRLQSDSAFAGDSDARLDFFYRRHPAFDSAWKRLPVFRLASPPEL